MLLQRLQAPPSEGVLGLIGDTPLVHLRSLSEATGCTILAKAEFLNPGGSIKDRVALQIVLDAERDGRLTPGALITEGTAGSTGVALAMVAAARGYKCEPVAPSCASCHPASCLGMAINSGAAGVTYSCRTMRRKRRVTRSPHTARRCLA